MSDQSVNSRSVSEASRDNDNVNPNDNIPVADNAPANENAAAGGHPAPHRNADAADARSAMNRALAVLSELQVTFGGTPCVLRFNPSINCHDEFGDTEPGRRIPRCSLCGRPIDAPGIPLLKMLQASANLDN
ncbi:hypothetical protein TKK_0018662 [Trichogramma kaykai]